MKFNYYIPTRILFGKGMLNRLSRQELPGKKRFSSAFSRAVMGGPGKAVQNKVRQAVKVPGGKHRPESGPEESG